MHEPFENTSNTITTGRGGQAASVLLVGCNDQSSHGEDSMYKFILGCQVHVSHVTRSPNYLYRGTSLKDTQQKDEQQQEGG